MADEERLDEDLAAERLNVALTHQYRSVLQYSIVASSLVGLEAQSLGSKLTDFGDQELDGVHLQEAIAPTGRDGRSEALEHMLEHLIVRKQHQIDFLKRAAA